MKHFKHHHLAIIPLLSLLSMSPTMVDTNFNHGRSIASLSLADGEKGNGEKSLGTIKNLEPKESKHVRYEKLVSKVKPEDASTELSADQHKEKLGGLKLKLIQERESFKKDLSDEALVSEQRKTLESLVAETLLIDKSVKSLQDKKEIDEAEAKIRSDVVLESKDIIESLLTDLESNEVLVVKAKEPKVEEPKKEDKPVVAETPKEEPKKEEPKKEEAKKEEEKKEVCEADEKNKVLTKQVEELMKQNNQIMQTFMGMAQIMVSMHQQQQRNPYMQNGPGWNQSPYQYNQPTTAGNWVYYPSGFQPQQQNIFQPQQQYQQYQSHSNMGGIYPDQMMQPQQNFLPQQQSSWAIQPDPRFNVQSNITPGTFGQDAGSFSFNMMAPSNPAPAVVPGIAAGAPAAAPLTSFIPR